MSEADFALLTSVYAALMARLPAQRDCAEFIELGRAVQAGPVSAIAILKRFGLAATVAKLDESVVALRATGHFTQAALTAALSAIVASWDRRTVGRRPSGPHRRTDP